MDRTEKIATIGAVLERAAEKLGDITRTAADLCYRRRPEMRALFLELDPSNPERLEGIMVEQTVYCLMYWPESPGEVETVLVSTIPHHIDTVGVRPEQFVAFFEAVGDVVAGTIPPEEAAQVQAWEQLRGELRDVMARSTTYARN